MERQIMIRHQSNEITLKIRNIINYLSLFAGSNDKIICNFCLNMDKLNILEEIKCIIQYNDIDEVVKIETNKSHEKYSDYKLVVCLKNMEYFLNVVEKYELNVMIAYNDIKVFINDNDGDFIIIDSNHENYNVIKKHKNN